MPVGSGIPSKARATYNTDGEKFLGNFNSIREDHMRWGRAYLEIRHEMKKHDHMIGKQRKKLSRLTKDSAEVRQALKATEKVCRDVNRRWMAAKEEYQHMFGRPFEEQV